jgi:xylan 1,4-beta-xylosidase
MFGQMGGRRLAVESTADAGLDALCKKRVRGSPDVSALASLQDRRLCVLVWHYHDDDVAGPAAAVDLSLGGLNAAKGPVRLHHYRIDQGHSNSFTAWKGMGSPQTPTREQYARLERSARLAELGPAESLRAEGGKLRVRFKLPRQAVSLLVFSWGTDGG